MSYRNFARPDDRGWNTGHWLDWLRSQRVAPPVLPADAGATCLTCRAPTPVGSLGTPYERCFSCNSVVSLSLDGFVPISYSLHSGLEGMLWRAKNESSYAWLRFPLGSLLWVFLARHESCIEAMYGGSFDLRIAVPSHASTRDGRSHLGSMIGCVKDFSQSWSEGALVKNSASKAEGRRAKVVDGLFSAAPVVKGKRILLFDDTFTTGGTLASAAHALKAAGAHTVVGISIGRQLSSEWEVSKELVATLPQRDLTLDSCVVHGGPSKDPFAALFGRAR